MFGHLLYQEATSASQPFFFLGVFGLLGVHESRIKFATSIFRNLGALLSRLKKDLTKPQSLLRSLVQSLLTDSPEPDSYLYSRSNNIFVLLT